MSSQIRLVEEASSPSSPSSGYGYIYLKNDGLFYTKNDAGTEVVIGGIDITGLSASSLALGDSFPFYDLSLTANKKATVAKVAGFANPALTQCRLSLATGDPVTSADQTAKTRLYLTPFNGNRISLFDGTDWLEYALTEIYIDIGTLASATPHDVFVYDNAGTLTLELLIWTDATNRATALSTQDGVPCKGGGGTGPTRKFVGTIYPPTTTTMEDSEVKRLVGNFWNLVPRKVYKAETENSWSLASVATRQVFNQTANKISVMFPFSGRNLIVLSACLSADLQTGEGCAVGIGLGDTTNVGRGCLSYQALSTVVDGHSNCEYEATPAAGFREFWWLEESLYGTPAFLGDNGGTDYQSAIGGWVWL